MGLKAPDGYRLLKEGETMLEGDIAYLPSAGKWYPRSKNVGFTYRTGLFWPTARCEEVPDDLLWD